MLVKVFVLFHFKLFYCTLILIVMLHRTLGILHHFYLLTRDGVS